MCWDFTGDGINEVGIKEPDLNYYDAEGLCLLWILPRLDYIVLIIFLYMCQVLVNFSLPRRIRLLWASVKEILHFPSVRLRMVAYISISAERISCRWLCSWKGLAPSPWLSIFSPPIIYITPDLTLKTHIQCQSSIFRDNEYESWFPFTTSNSIYWIKWHSSFWFKANVVMPKMWI